jgi:CHAT domain-containing protein
VAEFWESTPRTATAPAAVRLLTGSDASEDAFKRMAPGNTILHLATHAFFLDGECPSGLAGTRGIGQLIPETADEEEADTAIIPKPTNPLLLSGLALAGANRRDTASPDEEDGILTALEIAALDLSGVRWAILSACETGTGEFLNGEGIFGLRRAFQIAGVRTLVTSLWSVKDETTREWMNAFYHASTDENQTTVDAVRNASLRILRDRRSRGEDAHPFYWAAFVASGDWR